MARKLEGKIALITGGSSGIGLATAKDFAAEGAHVYITGRRQSELDRAVDEGGGQITAIQGDVSRMEDLDRLFHVIQTEQGWLDAVFANAGTGGFAPLGQITEEHFDKQFDLNVKGLLFTVQKALPLLRDGSSIVLNASIVSVKGNPAFSVYSATKAAVRSFARTWAVDLRERRIRVNAISPGVVPTPGYNTSLGMNEQQVDEFVQGSLASIPLGRAGTPEEIAKAVTFLVSPDSSYINGIELFVDGGLAQI
ncbi:SDR family NAD(P)-dependent oxidoreductase [Paludibaculum fermentans]|uniref:SDR family oxidoreductase n=1 Tax=Paludibaculum fermentans TaxID=1473598 RepID=A0A7S7NLM2_PALFE|nr:SDR family oxidoreductase [Paludibaculum fermentans]QOY85902.1 SDR family oxidoreductase [Paludibaculum fermentans]